MARGPFSSPIGVFLILGLAICLFVHLWSAIQIHDSNGTDSISSFETQRSRLARTSIVQPEPSLTSNDEKTPRLGTLSCEKWGGPPDPSEMVNWRDHDDPRSSSSHQAQETYLLFDADPAGWNNKRISFEIFCLLARIMGRTLVLPPTGEWFGFGFGFNANAAALGFEDVYDMNLLRKGINVITMKEFLDREPLTYANGSVATPPNNQTDWNGSWMPSLRMWLLQVTEPLEWRYEDCILAIPKDPKNVSALQRAHGDIQHQEHFGGYVPVDASVQDRMREILFRRNLCFDNSTAQKKYLYYQITQKSAFSMEFRLRLLVWFYQFLFFEDPAMELSAKRFVRDTLRYKDELQCAAARIVHMLRQASPDGTFHTFHCRRSEQFSHQFGRQPTAEEIVQIALPDVPPGSTVYIATDEVKHTWFAPFFAQWKVSFLSDYDQEIRGISADYYGMLDQLVASRGTKMFGSWMSTFTGYINRLRGYHAQLKHLDGWKEGLIESYFYQPQWRNAMRKYESPKRFWFGREYPIAWRDIDHNI
jgi:hypothetical protein